MAREPELFRRSHGLGGISTGLERCGCEHVCAVLDLSILGCEMSFFFFFSASPGSVLVKKPRQVNRHMLLCISSKGCARTCVDTCACVWTHVHVCRCMCMCVVKGMTFCLFSHLDNTVQVCITEGSSGHGRLNRTSDVMGGASLVGLAGTGCPWLPPSKVQLLAYRPRSFVITPPSVGLLHCGRRNCDFLVASLQNSKNQINPEPLLLPEPPLLLPEPWGLRPPRSSRFLLLCLSV